MTDTAPPPTLTVPTPNAVVDLAMDDGAIVRVRRHGNPDGPRIALSHGNGLAIDAYLPFWSLLLDRYDVILFDVRNHGQNPRHDPDHHVWDWFARDLETIYRGLAHSFGDKPVIGAFHSLASIAAVMHTLARGPRWSPLVLFDPPIFPREGHPLDPLEREHMREMGAVARRRPPRYDDPGVMAAQLRRRAMFSRWQPGSHDLFARATLRPADDGEGWELACPRELEARIFETNIDPTLWARLPEVPVPLEIIAADPDLPGQQAPALLSAAVAEDQGIAYAMIPDTTHFLQIEKPEAVLAAMEAFLRENGVDV
jgi:pimeloyl-ACP methyl ester carboxylesterase